MKYLKRPIPKGFQIYTDFEVAGLMVKEFRENFDDFICGENLEVSLVPEPDNAYDKYAIAVYGEYNRGILSSLSVEPQRIAVHLGYVPKSTAEGLQVTGILPNIIPRLHSVSEPGERWIAMTIDALGPKNSDLLERYFAHFESKQSVLPASFNSQTFIRLCGKKVKKGLTIAEADKIIHQLREDLTRDYPAKLIEMDALLRTIDSLLDDLSDAENAELYNMKKVPPPLVVSAVIELFGNGISASEIDEDFELIIEKILKRRPSLSRL